MTAPNESAQKTGGLTPAQRVLRARVAAHTSWAKTTDRSARTAAARKALLDRFDRQVDPDGILTPVERARRAEAARKAYYSALALKSSQSRGRGSRSARRPA